jgi:hypothetical protein
LGFLTLREAESHSVLPDIIRRVLELLDGVNEGFGLQFESCLQTLGVVGGRVDGLFTAYVVGVDHLNIHGVGESKMCCKVLRRVTVLSHKHFTVTWLKMKKKYGVRTEDCVELI